MQDGIAVVGAAAACFSSAPGDRAQAAVTDPSASQTPATSPDRRRRRSSASMLFAKEEESSGIKARHWTIEYVEWGE